MGPHGTACVNRGDAPAKPAAAHVWPGVPSATGCALQVTCAIREATLSTLGSTVDSGKIDAAVKNERDRIVVALRRLADRIESAPVERVSEGLAWVATAAETLVTTIERAIGGKR